MEKSAEMFRHCDLVIDKELYSDESPRHPLAVLFQIIFYLVFQLYNFYQTEWVDNW